jgi:hypothetical protein
MSTASVQATAENAATGKAVTGGFRKFSNGLREFIRKRHIWVTFAGAAIVLATFVGKETIREHVKDTIGSFESAQSTFEVREQNRNVLTALADIRDRLVNVESQVSRQRQVNSSILYWSSSVESTRQEFQLTKKLLDNMVSLNAKLPRDKERDALEHESKKRAAETDALYLPTIGAITNVGNKPGSKNRKLKQQEEQSIPSAVLKYYESQQAAALKIAAFGTSVLREAPKYREEKERSLSRWNAISYFLFGIGWGLGLIGKIYGVEAGGVG